MTRATQRRGQHRPGARSARSRQAPPRPRGVGGPEPGSSPCSSHQRLGDDVAFLGVNVQDSAEGRQSMLEATGITYDVAVDPSGDVFAALGAVTMPSTVFIDADGRVESVHGGALSASALEAGVDELVAS